MTRDIDRLERLEVFIRDRIAEDEEEFTSERDRFAPHAGRGEYIGDYEVARYDYAVRVLKECAAKRRLMDLLSLDGSLLTDDVRRVAEIARVKALHTMARVYDNHADY